MFIYLRDNKVFVEDKINYISQEKMNEVIEYIPSLGIRKWQDDDIKMLLKILYYCALRPSEGIYIKKESFNLKDREIYLGKTKTKRNDVAPIPKIFINELAEYLGTKETGRLFDKLTYNTFYRWLKKLGFMLDIEAWQVLEKDSGEKTVGHIFRKSVGKDMLSGVYGEKAKEIPIISKQLRHAKPSMTVDYYLKSSVEAVKEAW